MRLISGINIPINPSNNLLTEGRQLPDSFNPSGKPIINLFVVLGDLLKKVFKGGLEGGAAGATAGAVADGPEGAAAGGAAGTAGGAAAGLVGGLYDVASGQQG